MPASSDDQLLEAWRMAAAALDLQHAKARRIKQTFLRVGTFVVRQQWAGACHAVSAVLAVLLREQDVDCDLCLGEAAIADGAFDHSWVEIAAKVYDVAVALPLVASRAKSPVLAGIDLVSGSTTDVRYGIVSGQAPDVASLQVRTLPFSRFMQEFPAHPRGLWGVAADIASTMKLEVSPTNLSRRHARLAWTLRP